MEMAKRNDVMNEICSFHAMMNMSPRERAIAEARERYLFEKRSAYSAGVDHGFEQGKDSVARQVAVKLLARNAALSDIVDLSGLPEEEILKIAEKEK